MARLALRKLTLDLGVTSTTVTTLTERRIFGLFFIFGEVGRLSISGDKQLLADNKVLPSHNLQFLRVTSLHIDHHAFVQAMVDAGAIDPLTSLFITFNVGRRNPEMFLKRVGSRLHHLCIDKCHSE